MGLRRISGAARRIRGAWSWRALRAALLATAGLAAIGAGAGRAETVGGALIKAYLNNPDINTQRAAVRVADENVPKANAGYLPTVEATGNIGLERAQTSDRAYTLPSKRTHCSNRGATESPPTRQSLTATRRLIPSARPNRRCSARASSCATPSRTPCSQASRPTWTCCATPRSSTSIATTFRSCRSSCARPGTALPSAKSPEPTSRRRRRASPARRRPR